MLILDYEYKDKCHIRFFNCDNMEFMRECKENDYDLCICDPEYGIGASEMTMGSGKNKKWDKGKKWDSKPPEQIYFNSLFNICKNQIIWGGNYFNLPLTKSWIFWDKGIYGDCTFADGELAWTSFNTVLRIAKIRYKGFLGADAAGRIHPTQKPIALYRWLLQKYAKQGDRILDTHGGSMTLARACYEEGFDLDIMELDKEYFDKGVLAFKQHVSQYNLFN